MERTQAEMVWAHERKDPEDMTRSVADMAIEGERRRGRPRNVEGTGEGMLFKEVESN